jgi:Dolichyl-phosphate-mannose-protein mannosyltransferase
MSVGTDGLPANIVAPLIPWWARPKDVAIIVGAYCVLFALITGLLSSAFNIDDEIAADATQSLLLNYSARNPPLYYWILYGLQQIVDPNPLTFALVRYTLLFLFAWILFAIARRVIIDPRLQALSAFAISLIWVIGYHSHRLYTHTNLMIVFIALTALLLVLLRERPTTGRYAALGASIALGTLSKFGYLNFLAVAAAGAISVAPYRRVLLDRRIIISVLVAAVPLVTFFAIGAFRQQHYVGAVMNVISPEARPGIGHTAFILVSAWLGYVTPFLPIFLLTVWPWRTYPMNRGGLPIDDARHFLRNTLIAGTIIVCVGVFMTENINIRDRHFHDFYALITVYAFAEADRRPIDARRLLTFAATLIAVAGGIAFIFTLQRVAPSRRLCDVCVQSVPYVQFARELRARFGPAPTLVTPIDAGQLRINMPAARVLELAHRVIPPPLGHARPCVLVWNDVTGKGGWHALLERTAAKAGVRLQDAERITLQRWAPLSWLTGEWPIDFYVLTMPETSAPCQ